MLARLGRGRVRRPALAAGDAFEGTISVVIPARDEAARIGPCLDGLAGDPDVLEVIVVDDGSTDGTAAVAAARGARVVTAGAAPAGWVGKPWALQRGLEAARGDIVVSRGRRHAPAAAGSAAARWRARRWRRRRSSSARRAVRVLHARASGGCIPRC